MSSLGGGGCFADRTLGAKMMPIIFQYGRKGALMLLDAQFHLSCSDTVSSGRVAMNVLT